MPKKGDVVAMCDHAAAGENRPVKWFELEEPAEMRHRTDGRLVGHFSWICICVECSRLPGAPTAQATNFMTLAEDVETRATGILWE